MPPIKKTEPLCPCRGNKAKRNYPTLTQSSKKHSICTQLQAYSWNA